MIRIDLGLLFPIRRPRLPFGRWLIGLAILLVLLGFFWVCGVFSQGPVEPQASYGAALFFSVNIAYIVPIFGYISERTLNALDVLAPDLDAERPTVEAWCRRIRSKPAPWFAVVAAIGVTTGVLHNLVLYGSMEAAYTWASSSPAFASIVVGTMLIWLVFTAVVAALLDNALLLNRAARCAPIRPFDTRRLRPFAMVAVISTLGLIGAQAAFPIMSIESGLSPLAYIPGLVATGAPMLLLAALPIWPLHRRMAAQKRDLLAAVDNRLDTVAWHETEQTTSMTDLASLLTYRREIAQAPVWPFDTGVVARLALYLVIPPLTWVGAALIENVVDLFV